MLRYIGKRLLLLIPTLLGVMLISFVMLYAIPGDPAQIIAGVNSTPEIVEQIRHELGLDQPVYVQFFIYAKNVFTGNFGISVVSRAPVLYELIPRFINTFALATLATIFASLVGIMLGVVSSVKRGSISDNFARILSILGTCAPSFLIGYLLLIIFALYLRVLPPFGNAGLESYIMPVVTLAFWSIASVSSTTRASMLGVLDKDYIRTAKSLGIRRRKVILKYALKNALIPVVTVIGLNYGYTIGGAVLTEMVFAWPGIGKFLVDSYFARDFPVMQAGILLIAVAFMIINLITDIIYTFLDPRIRLTKGEIN